MQPQPVTIARLIVTKAESSGATLPKPMRTSYDRIITTLDRIRNRDFGTDLGAAVARAITEDRDPTECPQVQRALNAQALDQTGLDAHIETALVDDFRDVCLSNADAFVGALRKPFDTAAGVLAASADVIGDYPLEDYALLGSGDGQVATAWSNAKVATGVTADAQVAWATFMQFTRLVQLNPNHRALRLASIDYSTWIERGLSVEASKHDAWTLAAAGISLSLPTAGEYADRVQALSNGYALAESRHQEANHRALMNR